MARTQDLGGLTSHPGDAPQSRQPQWRNHDAGQKGPSALPPRGGYRYSERAAPSSLGGGQTSARSGCEIIMTRGLLAQLCHDATALQLRGGC